MNKHLDLLEGSFLVPTWYRVSLDLGLKLV